MNLLIKYPSRERPVQFFDRLTTMAKLADAASELYFVFTFDQNDASMFPMAKKLEDCGLQGEIYYDHSKGKIDAVNRDLDKTKYAWDALVLMSDDMECKVKGWDTRIREDFKEPGAEALWYFDGHQSDICTMPIITRANYERYGYIYDPRFRSLFADNVQTEVNQRIGVMKYHDVVLFHHVHPANVTGVIGDQLHKRNEMAWSVDERTYKQLKAKGFPR
jgi:hypothetical protein